MHFFKEAPRLETDELEVYGDHVYVVRISSDEPPYVVNFYFHNKHLYDEFIAALKNETWRR
jgi:hypothetical protein